MILQGARDTRSGITTREGIVLAILLGIIFLLPLAFSHLSVKMWKELIWHNPVDISMIEWTGAFLNIFLFLLLIEHYRQSEKKSLIFISSGFLVMGILGFVYALSKPGTETAAWIKCMSLLLGGFYFLLGITARKQTGKDLPRAFLWIILPSILVAVTCAWIPHGLKPVLPKILSSAGVSTVFGELLFWIPGAFFFVAALPWLHDYMKKRRKEDLIFAVLILIYAQVSLTVRYSNPWGVLWWGWHIGLLVAGIIAALYLLVLCLRYSLIWRLLLSMGFCFGLTVLISSSVMQSYFEKRTNDELKRRFAVQQKNILLESRDAITFSNQNLKHLVRDFFLSGEYLDNPGKVAGELCSKNRAEWPKYLLEVGFYSDDDAFASSDLEDEGAEFREKALEGLKNAAFKNISGKTVFSEFYFDSTKNRWVSAATLSFRLSSGARCFFYNVLDVTRLKNRNIISSSDKRIKNSIGRMIICSRSGRFLECSLPKSYTEGFDTRIPETELPLAKKIAIQFSDIPGAKAKIVQLSYFGRDYLVFANYFAPAEWTVLDLLDEEGIPIVSYNRSKYVFEATGMIVLLLGFIMLLFLLNYQIARPLNQIVKATEKLEEGDFSVRINSRDTNEFGIVSKSFDTMVTQLQKIYYKLHNTIAERTKALEDARTANHARTSFFTNVSHELRTPLHGILSFSRLGMDKERLNDEKKMLEFFKSINDSAQRLLKMINELLDFAKIESGHMEFEFTDTSLFMISLQTYEELKANFEEKNVKFICVKPEFDTNACIDREKIAMVMRNLIGNALKFSESGTELKVSFVRGLDMLSVTVTDKGAGIPEEDIDIIFDRFFQSDIAKVKGGTGLGLSICREIVKRHNGTIYARNNSGGGASFTFSVPLTRAAGKVNPDKKMS
ncbi:MAG TPA: hypothetical protein DCZ94_03095 [Lentisphaeria bacterium]|nr:MAG: hypothetical protein A2X48_15915 [Lentisphaerae bacterium GWF2_49_21]HBC85921.1 hypothetical protein [Lentisphaeria bacterium]